MTLSFMPGLLQESLVIGDGDEGLSLAENIQYQSCHRQDIWKTKQEYGISSISANMNSLRKSGWVSLFCFVLYCFALLCFPLLSFALFCFVCLFLCLFVCFRNMKIFMIILQIISRKVTMIVLALTTWVVTWEAKNTELGIAIGTDGITHTSMISLVARFMGPTWGPSGADRTQVGPMFAPGPLLSGMQYIPGNTNTNCTFWFYSVR